MDDWLTVKVIKQILEMFGSSILVLIVLNSDWLGPLSLRLIQMLQLVIAQLRGGGDAGRADMGRRRRMATMSGEVKALFERLLALERGKGLLLAKGVGVLQAIAGGARQLVGV
ncbi:hypothetical protein [Roseateles sp.]|uniref:hypothetical protein n=1 Tax=Roseateles sp. TaxID=1971397 RepID=UPI002E075E07|nr:hypothetical protein [Roseateles sp.]